MHQPHARTTIRRPVFIAAAVVAVVLRLLCMQWPHNYDLDSWSLVADLVLDGRNVYGSTHRYNYGPLWMGILGGLKWLAGDAYFRLAVCLFLSGVDVATAALLRARGLALVAMLFLFSPWTIMISGHHHMFDNVAILVGLLAVTWVEARPGMRDGEQRLSSLSLRDTLVGAVLIGFSIIAKHVLWLFPVWMAFRTRNFSRRTIWLCIPVLMFALSFVPFWAGGKAGILKHVVHYAAASNAPMFSMLAPNIVDLVMGCGPHFRLVRVVFGATLIAAGALLRRRTLFEWYVTYLLFLVLLSSAIWNQFMVIPVMFTLLHRNIWGLFYHLLAIPYYIIDDVGFNLGEAMSPRWDWLEFSLEMWGRHLFIVLLALTYLKACWSTEIQRAQQHLTRLVYGSLRGHQ